MVVLNWKMNLMATTITSVVIVPTVATVEKVLKRTETDLKFVISMKKRRLWLQQIAVVVHQLGESE